MRSLIVSHTLSGWPSVTDSLEKSVMAGHRRVNGFEESDGFDSVAPLFSGRFSPAQQIFINKS